VHPDAVDDAVKDTEFDGHPEDVGDRVIVVQTDHESVIVVVLVPLRDEDIIPEVVPLVLIDVVKEDDGEFDGEILDVIVVVPVIDEVAQPETDDDSVGEILDVIVVVPVIDEVAQSETEDDSVGETLGVVEMVCDTVPVCESEPVRLSDIVTLTVGETLEVVEIEYDAVPVCESEPVRLSDVVTLPVVESVADTLIDGETLPVVESVADTLIDDETLLVIVSVEVGDKDEESLEVVVLDKDGIIIDTVEDVEGELPTVFVNPAVTDLTSEIVCRVEIVDLPDGDTSALELETETELDAEPVIESCCVIVAAFEAAGDVDGV